MRGGEGWGVRLKIKGRTVEQGNITAIGTIKDNYLGLIDDDYCKMGRWWCVKMGRWWCDGELVRWVEEMTAAVADHHTVQFVVPAEVDAQGAVV